MSSVEDTRLMPEQDLGQHGLTLFQPVLDRFTFKAPPQSGEQKAKLNEEETARIKRERDAAWSRIANKLGARYAQCSFENYYVHSGGHYQQKVLTYLDETWCCEMRRQVEQGQGLLLVGPRGTGKDHLAVACLKRAVMDFGYSAYYADCQNLFSIARDRIANDQDEKGLFGDLRSPQILLLSDPVPQSGAITQYQQSILWNIIDGRYRQRKSTWITANVSGSKELEDRLGPTISDRLIHGAAVVVCQWPSYRQIQDAITPTRITNQ